MSPSEEKMNRRDWFRLKGANGETLQQEGTSGRDESHESLRSNPDLGASSSMQPIALPPNHDGMDLAKLPSMREAQLRLDEVLELLNDIETHATEIQLLQRERSLVSNRVHDNPKKGMELARQALTNASVTRLQIRYSWQNALWIDTLETTSMGFRLVRIEHRSR